MRTRAIAASALGLVACTAASQPAADPHAALEVRLQETLDGLHAANTSTRVAFPGATAAVALPDGHVLTLATGLSDVEAGVPTAADMVMPAGSIGKTFVSAVALSLVNEELLDLDAPISTWLGDEPWFRRLPNGRDITLRRLLNHSSGLVDHVQQEEFQRVIRGIVRGPDRDRILTPRELIAFVLDQDPLFAPGEGYSYTDTGYILVGLILEKVGGRPYDSLLQERLLGPLELTRTRPQDRRSVPRLAQGYARQSDVFGLSGAVLEDGTLPFHPQTEWTGGGLYSNARDLARWAQILYQGRAIDGPYLDVLLGSVAPVERDDPRQSYGLGVDIFEGPLGPSYGHDGFFPGYNSKMAFYPDHGVAVAMQVNADRTRLSPHLDQLARVAVEFSSRDEPAVTLSEPGRP